MEQPELSSELCSTSHGEALHSHKAQANKAAPLALLADSEIAVLKTKIIQFDLQVTVFPGDGAIDNYS